MSRHNSPADFLPQISGDLFEAVQQSRLFKDSKTFVDAIPKHPPEDIINAYHAQKNQPDFDLKTFVMTHFTLPTPANNSADHPLDTSSVRNYISSLWPRLERSPADTTPHDSLIPLEFLYVVPGGRFREIYYWDSYFTSLGLVEAGYVQMVESMVRNFVSLQTRLGLIPNGNRQYYVTRSQPPVLSLMLGLLYDAKYAHEPDGRVTLAEFLPALLKEHAFWTQPQRSVVFEGGVLNHYWDEAVTPRQEAYKEDVALAARSQQDAESLYRNVRAGAESGWDFSSRWFETPDDFGSIRTTKILPVDLNCLLYALESSIVWLSDAVGDSAQAKQFKDKAQARQRLIHEVFWNETEHFYFDYDYEKQCQTNVRSLAAVLPLFVQVASSMQADAVTRVLMRDFLKEGGLVTTLNDTTQQWDSPNGWAPLQWFAVQGLRHYAKHTEAKRIMQHWLHAVETNFAQTHALMEKYDVVNPGKQATGGEYSVQEGFGWTNGVTLKFLTLLANGDHQ